MKNFFNSRLFIALLFLIMACSLHGLLTSFPKKSRRRRKFQVQRRIQKIFTILFSTKIFSIGPNPFAEMDRMQKEMLKNFNTFGLKESAFENWYKNKFGGGKSGELVQREDGMFVYYEIDLGTPPQKVNVTVKDGQVGLSLNAESKSEKDDQRSYASVSYQRSFPVPPNVNAEKYQVSQENNKVVVKFPKLKP